MGRAPNHGAPQRVSAHVVPKGPSSRATHSPFDGENENERTALESGWEDENSTTVAEQGDVAEKIRALGTERPERAPAKTGITATNMLDEPTVDDRRAQPAIVARQAPAASARLVITAGNDKGNTLAIQPGKTYTVGRAIDNDLVLTDIAVSRKHFDLKHEAGAWMLVDRRSGNGTLVNGNVEDNAFLLASGDVIEIGNTTFRFEMPGGLPRSHPSSAMETPATMSLDQSMDAALEDVRGKRPQPPVEEDDDDEQSTVAGKPLEEPPPQPPRARPPTLGPPPQPPPVRARPPTNAPPPPIARTRSATNAPPLPPMAANPAPLPYSPPPATTLPVQPMRLAPQQPTILGDGKGLPMAPVQPSPASTLPGPGASPVLYNNGYPMAAPMPPMGPAPSYGNVPMMQGYASPQPPTGARRTWLLVGAAALAVAAAVLTVVIIQAAAGDDDDSKPAPAENTPPVASTEPAPSAAAATPTVEPIKSATPTPEAPAAAPPTPAPPGPSVTPIKPDEPAPAPKPDEPATAVTPAKPGETTTRKPDDSAAKAAAAARQREAAAAKKEREEAAARKREEAAERRREEAAAKAAAREAKQGKRVAADTGGVKDKADGLYRKKNFSGAASALRAAAKGSDAATELKSLAGVYENFGKAYNVGMAPGTPPKQAFDLLVKARNFDNRAGNAFTSEINGRLAEIAPKAAVAFMADKNYVRARNAVAVAEAGGKGNSSTQGVRASLESAAGKLFKEAQAELGKDEKSARDKLKQVQQMVDAKSQWHQKAGKLLSGG